MTDTTDTPADSVRLERTFGAPIATVWSMWAEAEHFASWYGPMGATIPTAEMDVTVGGGRTICMRMETPDGPMEMWFTGAYTEIDEPTRLVYTEAMADPEGNATSPFTEVIVELTDLGDSTKVVLTHVGVPADSPGAMGWTMALDKLEGVLAG